MLHLSTPLCSMCNHSKPQTFVCMQCCAISSSKRCVDPPCKFAPKNDHSGQNCGKQKGLACVQSTVGTALSALLQTAPHHATSTCLTADTQHAMPDRCTAARGH